MVLWGLAFSKSICKNCFQELPLKSVALQVCRTGDDIIPEHYALVQCCNWNVLQWDYGSALLWTVQPYKNPCKQRCTQQWLGLRENKTCNAILCDFIYFFGRKVEKETRTIWMGWIIRKRWKFENTKKDGLPDHTHTDPHKLKAVKTEERKKRSKLVASRSLASKRPLREEEW